MSAAATGLGTWTSRAVMPETRMFVAAAAVGGKVYALGGQNPLADCTYTNVTRIYDPASDAWSFGTPMPINRTAAYAAALDGKIHLVTGGTGCGPFTARYDVYDPATDVWSPAPDAPARYGAAVVSHAGKLYLIGGFIAGRGLDWVDEFDPAAQRWVRKSPMPSARGYVSFGVLHGTLYAASGCCDAPMHTFEAYDIAADRWTRLAPLPFSNHGAVGAVIDGALYLVGTGDDFRGVKRYDPRTDSWSDDTPMPAPLLLHRGAVIGSTLYVVGGFDVAAGRMTGVTYAFTPGPPPDRIPPVITVTPTGAALWPPNHRMVTVATISARDDRDPSPSLDVTVTSSEPTNGLGDGDTKPDWEIQRADDGAVLVRVRAERSGRGSGRSYTISAAARDGAGNTSGAQQTVHVPLNQKS